MIPGTATENLPYGHICTAYIRIFPVQKYQNALFSGSNLYAAVSRAMKLENISLHNIRRMNKNL